MIVRITETAYSEYIGAHKCEPVCYKIPFDLQKMVDDIRQIPRDSAIKAEIVSEELTDSDNLPCSNPYHNSPSCTKEVPDGVGQGKEGV